METELAILFVCSLGVVVVIVVLFHTVVGEVGCAHDKDVITNLNYLHVLSLSCYLLFKM